MNRILSQQSLRSIVELQLGLALMAIERIGGFDAPPSLATRNVGNVSPSLNLDLNQAAPECRNNLTHIGKIRMKIQAFNHLDVA